MKALGKTRDAIWGDLSELAWQVRDNAALNKPDIGTRVGCAIHTSFMGRIVAGCNVEHPFLSTTIHAEANAIGTMIAKFGPDVRATKILVTAERHKFTPCGQCMDMIMQYGGEECKVGYQNERGGTIHWATAKELMPEYPC